MTALRQSQSERGLASSSGAVGRKDAERFSLQLSSVVPARELQAWFDGAPAWPAPAGEAIYATGVMLPREEGAVQLVARWIGQGRVEAFQRRDPDEPRRMHYLVRKRAVPGQVGGAQVGGVPGDSAPPADLFTLPPLAQRLLERLRGHAAGGSACPSNARLAAGLGLIPPASSSVAVGPQERERGRLKIKNAMAALEVAGAVRIDRRGTTRPRVVTILAAGAAQGLTTAKGPKEEQATKA